MLASSSALFKDVFGTGNIRSILSFCEPSRMKSFAVNGMCSDANGPRSIGMFSDANGVTGTQPRVGPLFSVRPWVIVITNRNPVGLTWHRACSRILCHSEHFQRLFLGAVAWRPYNRKYRNPRSGHFNQNSATGKSTQVLS